MICMPAIEFARNLFPNCEVMGVIGYEIAKRKKDGPNAEPIVIFRKGYEKLGHQHETLKTIKEIFKP